MVLVAATAAKAKYCQTFTRQDIILIGDTQLHIESAPNTGATPIGVANGGYSVADLVAAGASIVLPDLRDPKALQACVLGTKARKKEDTSHGRMVMAPVSRNTFPLRALQLSAENFGHPVQSPSEKDIFLQLK